MMDAKEVLRQGLRRAGMVTEMLLGDLGDGDLLVRSAASANHIAWQLGHLIASEHRIGETIQPGAMPALPADFADRYTKSTASDDEPGHFLPKGEYLALYGQQRAALTEMLDRIPAADLDRAAPESMQRIASTVGDLFLLAADHELMHSGQFSTVRRKLGKAVVF